MMRVSTILSFQYVSPGTLLPYAKNARQHPPEQVAMIMASIKEFGFTMPILVRDDMTLIAGHGRLEAAHKLGLKQVPIVKASHLSEAQARALVHVDNQIALKSQWDFDMLKLELDDIQFDFEPYDFDLPKIEDVSKEGLTDDDDVPEVEQNIHGVELGDVWQLGSHRLICGDSTDALLVDKLLTGEKADMVFTDPPYGMNLDTDYSKIKGSTASQFGKNYPGKKYKPVIGDDQPYDPSFLLGYFQDVGEIFLWGADYYHHRLPVGGGCFLIWDKSSDEADEMIGNAYEIAWSKQKHKKTMARIYYRGAFWQKKDDKRVHPTQKPIELTNWFFTRWGKESKLVVDLYLGSGSTLIACEKTNRKCFGMELDPHYCSVIIERWQKFTGKTAERVQ